MNKLSKVLLGLLIASSFVACTSTPKKAAESKPVSSVSDVVVMDKKAVDPRTDVSNILASRVVFFEYDQYEIRPEFMKLLEAHAAYGKAHPSVGFVLEGHADERGTREYNLSLGQKRSVAVQNALINLGVSAEKIETISYGKERPTCLAMTEKCYGENRRAILLYTDER